MKKLLLLAIASLLTKPVVASIPKLNLDTRHITLSGLSSGGFMANQMHLAYAKWVSGVGIISAGPNYCAQGSILKALASCVNKTDEPIAMDAINAQLNKWRKTGLLAPEKALKKDKVWLFHGTKDSRVAQGVTDALYQQYQQWLSPSQIRYIKDKPFAHLFPTQSEGGDCSTSKAPFIGACGYNAAGKMLNFISQATIAPSTSGQLYPFNQHVLGGKAASSLADTGYVFIPANCANGQQCQVHVSFHGCNQNAQAVGTDYATLTGINQWAQQHNMVVVYPQTKKSTMMPINPQACWDWWGYTDSNYATRKGQQIMAVKNMVMSLAGEKYHE